MAAPATACPGPREDFYWENDLPEPHAGRKAALIKYYPEIAKLMGPEPLTKWVILGVVTFQLTLAVVVSNAPWWVFVIAAYVVGATATQNLFLAIHELSHRLGSKSAFRNRCYTLLANLPIVVPFGITFAPYHLEHHRFQGHDNIDTDIPTLSEAQFFGNKTYNYPMRCFMKFLFMSIQIFFYALRPVIVRPQVMQMLSKDPWYLTNTIVQVAFDLTYVYFVGIKPVFFLLLCVFFAGSVHPIAGHFLAEHYVFDTPDHETFSYYGPLNFFTYNVGYHNEHHDFPNVPWTRLPKVREIAREYYDTLPECKSWWGAIVRYIIDDTAGPFSRVKRPEVLAEGVTNSIVTEKTHAVLKSKGIQMKNQVAVAEEDLTANDATASDNKKKTL